MMFHRMVLVGLLIGCALGVSSGQEIDPARTTFDPCQALTSSDLFKPIREIRTELADDKKRMPPDCSLGYFGGQGSHRAMEPKIYTWQPTNFFHMPTYFDDVPLERYGQTKHPYLQPVISGARFLAQVPALPYKVGVNCPHECVTTLGHRPPGSCVPCIKQTLPWEADALLLQGGVSLGLVLLLP